MIVGIGDSNLEFGGHGWQHGFKQQVDFGRLVYYPGGSTRDVIRRLSNMDHTTIEDRVPEDSTILVTLGINDSIQGVSMSEFAQNHMIIKNTVESIVGPRSWIWMPSHVSGQTSLEMNRWWLKLKANRKNVPFVNLHESKYRQLTEYRAFNDPFHLTIGSYEQLAEEVMESNPTLFGL
jgi:lysophospholipase L1-like esterase